LLNGNTWILESVSSQDGCNYLSISFNSSNLDLLLKRGDSDSRCRFHEDTFCLGEETT
jgi:hypothetical protein